MDDRTKAPGESKLAIFDSFSRAGWRGGAARCDSLLGMGAGIITGLAFWFTSREVIAPLFWLLGVGLAQLRLLCNLIDGMVAIEAGKNWPGGRVV